MAVEDELVFGLPDYACESLKQSIRQEAHGDERFAEELARKVDTGEITFKEAEETYLQLGEGLSQMMTDFCAKSCGEGVCQLAGYGVGMMDVGTTRDFDDLSLEEDARYRNFQHKTVISMTAQMADGVFLG